MADPPGPGVRTIDDIAVAEDGSAKLGQLAAHARQAHPLEMCPTSSVRTGAVRDLAEHPVPVEVLRLPRFRAIVNIDRPVNGWN